MDIRHPSLSTRLSRPSLLVVATLTAFIGTALMRASAEQPVPSDGMLAPEKFLEAETATRGQRPGRPLTYGSWRKVCFKASQEAGSKMVCRTTISGRRDSGQIALRV